MFHYDATHSGNYTPVAGTTGPVVTKLWSYATGDNSGDSSPVVANGIVYIGSADYNFYALNTMTGAVVWTNTSNYDIQSTPAVANGTVYFTSVLSNLYALNATTGAEIWTNNTGSHYIYSSPTVANNTVYFADDTYLHALDATTGVQRWSKNIGGGNSIPAIANDVLYYSGGSMYHVCHRCDQRDTDLELIRLEVISSPPRLL